MVVFGAKEIIIDLKNQKIYAIEHNVIIMDSKISTGKKDYRTPVGTFRITEKKRYHISTIYNLPMPYMLRLTNWGVAIHQGYVPNYPASHGCIRVPKNFAQKLFAWTPLRTKVSITYKFEDFNKTLITYKDFKTMHDQNKTLDDRNMTQASIDKKLMDKNATQKKLKLLEN